MTPQEYMRRRKLPDWKFSEIVSADSFTNVNKIHPLKQKAVKEIVDAAREDPAVRRLIVFGSSTRYDCDNTSDLDICIDWVKACYDKDGVLYPFTVNMRKAISQATKGGADVVNYDYIDDTLVESAVRNGVVVYEQNVQPLVRDDNAGEGCAEKSVGG